MRSCRNIDRWLPTCTPTLQYMRGTMDDSKIRIEGASDEILQSWLNNAWKIYQYQLWPVLVVLLLTIQFLKHSMKSRALAWPHHSWLGWALQQIRSMSVETGLEFIINLAFVYYEYWFFDTVISRWLDGKKPGGNIWGATPWLSH